MTKELFSKDKFIELKRQAEALPQVQAD